MPNAFPFSLSPFDCLDPDERRQVRGSVDIAYFPQQAVILEPGATPSHLFVIVKGYVQQMDEGEVVATLGPDDCFDGRSLVAGRVSSRFVAAQEVVGCQLARQTVIELIASNATFGALLFDDLGHKLSVLAERQQQREPDHVAAGKAAERRDAGGHQQAGKCHRAGRQLPAGPEQRRHHRRHQRGVHEEQHDAEDPQVRNARER